MNPRTRSFYSESSPPLSHSWLAQVPASRQARAVPPLPFLDRRPLKAALPLQERTPVLGAVDPLYPWLLHPQAIFCPERIQHSNSLHSIYSISGVVSHLEIL